jgi:hypothetical protein
MFSTTRLMLTLLIAYTPVEKSLLALGRAQQLLTLRDVVKHDDLRCAIPWPAPPRVVPISAVSSYLYGSAACRHADQKFP